MPSLRSTSNQVSGLPRHTARALTWSRQQAVPTAPLCEGYRAAGEHSVQSAVHGADRRRTRVEDGHILAASSTDRPAALLLVPYWLWVTYAAALNAAILARNR